MSRGAEPMRNGSEPHSHIPDPFDRQQRLHRARRDTREVVAQETGRSIGKNDRRAVLRMRENGAGRTGLDAVAASRTALQKTSVLNGTGWPQPVVADRRQVRRGSGIPVTAKLLGRSGDRPDGVLHEIAPAV